MRPRCLLVVLALVAPAVPAGEPDRRTYENRLTPIADAKPLLADHPTFVEPIRDKARFEAPVLIDEPGADLDVRGWRYSYNARGIIEIPNCLRADRTAVLVVHPWGIDDGQGWKTPEPSGAAFAGYPGKNAVVMDHMKAVINPFLKSLRGRVGLVGYSLPGTEDPIRKKLYRSVHSQPSESDRRQGARELTAKLGSFTYKAQGVPQRLSVSRDKPAVDYFRQFPGIDAGARYNNEDFWKLPIPVARPIEVGLKDVVFYDGEGYEVLRDFLRKAGVRHVLLAGYHTDMCVCATTAGYKNLRNDFNVFLVGDATQATFPSSDTPRFATTAAVSYAALDLFITQASWVKLHPRPAARR
jgi:hypothetical protein